MWNQQRSLHFNQIKKICSCIDGAETQRLEETYNQDLPSCYLHSCSCLLLVLSSYLLFLLQYWHWNCQQEILFCYLHSCSCSCTTDCYFSYNDRIVIIFPAHVSVLLIITTPTMMPFKLTFKKSPVVIFTPAHVDVLLIVATPKIESCLQHYTVIIFSLAPVYILLIFTPPTMMSLKPALKKSTFITFNTTPVPSYYLLIHLQWCH